MLGTDGDRAIVNVASTLAHTAAPGVAPYAAAKGGHRLHRCCAPENRPVDGVSKKAVSVTGCIRIIDDR
jgi:NAD(P)-dependent dehydrogenase (short-subunit alcohol dehydrogenase family)